jgi:hypothetical protein
VARRLIRPRVLWNVCQGLAKLAKKCSIIQIAYLEVNNKLQGMHFQSSDGLGTTSGIVVASGKEEDVEAKLIGDVECDRISSNSKSSAFFAQFKSSTFKSSPALLIQMALTLCSSVKEY